MDENDNKADLVEIVSEQIDEINKKAEPVINFTLGNGIAFILTMAAIWFVGAVLTPFFPEEIIIMIVGGIMYFMWGFIPTNILNKVFKKNK